MATRGIANRTGLEWLSSLPACLLLLSVVVFSTSSDIHNQMLKLGEHFWDSYYQLRSDPQPPTCDPDPDIEAQVNAKVAASGEEDSLLGGLIASEPVDPDAVRESLLNARDACRAKYTQYETTKERITPAVKAYRNVELFISDLVAFGLTSQRYILALLVMVCAATATFTRHHIAMRGIESRLDYRVSYFLQFIANIMLLLSSWFYRAQTHAGGGDVPVEREILHDLWISGFLLLTFVSLFRLFREPEGLKQEGSLSHAFLSVPLYTTMCLISGTYFAFLGHAAGIGIYLDKMMELSDMFLNVGLYVWVGMMLKQTRVAPLVFDLFRPWKMPPELLAVVAVVVAAIPTAYTGASGIFVIAAGSVIYAELRAAGARRQLALAASAMSGSMGVVLRPCLLVVVIAYLNREVTTDDLFGWGVWVFLLTATLFLTISMTVTRQNPINFAPIGEALPATLKAFKPLIPYALVIVAVIVFYSLALNVGMDEFSAPRILPVMMIGILIYEHLRYGPRRKDKPVHDDDNPHGLERNIRKSTNETTSEIGALLLLFGLSVSIGGVIERSGVMGAFPASFDSPWTAMFLMVVVLVILGMIMDAFGAVILVSATVATLAYDSGIDPIHFWMTTLVAFELGYLSPPVALNHLLTRQVVGEAEVTAAYRDVEGASFYQRHERVLMPLIVMGLALVLVAFVPLMVYAG
ncbi:TRAP transporter large permease subunit [Marinobacteraceae bacterium S3BR75-40.1]